jgi:hypothetical protein
LGSGHRWFWLVVTRFRLWLIITRLCLWLVVTRCLRLVGNVSLQIFLPCPAKDGHLAGQQIQIVRYPHLYQLQPWRAQAEILYGHRDLSSPDRTITQTRKMGWHFDRREKVTGPDEAPERGVQA